MSLSEKITTPDAWEAINREAATLCKRFHELAVHKKTANGPGFYGYVELTESEAKEAAAEASKYRFIMRAVHLAKEEAERDGIYL